jgi:serine/threonine-protein kinase
MTEDLLQDLKTALADHYDIEGELGEGGMAYVFVADDIKHDRKVAIKVLKPDLASSLGTERFLREIKNAAKLSHPHIMPLYDSGEANGILYYVMPLVEGESLADYITREKQLSIEEAVKITREIAEALSVAHSYGMVHRDIKPENVMMTGGHALVADFGIALAVGQAGGERLTQTGTSIGTPAYMSPEQAAGDPNLDGRSDIYSLGCILYEILIGQIPFTAPTPQAMIARHTLDHITPPSIMRDSIPPDLENIIITAMEKTPADRFRTAQEFAEALGAVEQGVVPKVHLSTMTHRHTTGTYAPRETVRKRTWLISAMAAVILIGGGIAARLLLGAGSARTIGELGGLDPRSVAVLYFEDLSPNGSLGHVADGITEGLIDELSRVSGLNVISRNGVAQYRESGIPNDSIARALETGSLVTGSIEPEADRLRVTVRLVDGFRGADVERTTVALPAERMLAVQDSVAENVSSFLRKRLGEEVRLRERRAGATDAVAWTLVQRAERLRKDAFELEENEPERAIRTYLEADSLAAQAATIDPQWVVPVVLRGWLSYDLSFMADGMRQRIERVEAAIEYGSVAVGLDRTYGDALHLRGRSRYLLRRMETTPNPQQLERLLEEARADLEAAVDADPTLANAWYALSQLHYQREDNVSAVIAARRAYEADAFLSNQDRNLAQLFLTHYDLEQFQDADTWCNEGARRFPDDFLFLECQLFILISPWADADLDRAWQLAAEVDSLARNEGNELVGLRARMWVAGVLARSNMPDSARAVIVATQADPSIDPELQLASDEALIRIMLGEQEEAIRLLLRYNAANPGHGLATDHDLHWWWRPLRDHPRFRDVAESSR